MKHAQPVRVDLKMRTVFNRLGPLTNPAGATAQFVGAPSLHTAELIAGAIMALGMQHGFVVHSSDGLERSPPRVRRRRGRSATARWNRGCWSLPTRQSVRVIG